MINQAIKDEVRGERQKSYNYESRTVVDRCVTGMLLSYEEIPRKFRMRCHCFQWKFDNLAALFTFSNFSRSSSKPSLCFSLSTAMQLKIHFTNQGAFNQFVFYGSHQREVFSIHLEPIGKRSKLVESLIAFHNASITNGPISMMRAGEAKCSLESS